MKTVKPEWIKVVTRNIKSRERYYIKKYGTLERMYEKDRKFQDQLDADSFEDEMEIYKTDE